MSKINHDEFKQLILDYYSNNKRIFPWRQTSDPYKILVSEIMLQQTQTDRVVPKFNAFISEFPYFNSLAQAPLSKVLKLWSGLGYNRRALYLHKTAQRVRDTCNGRLPEEEKDLFSLPGIGKYTAGAIRAFAYNKRALFIETNIRRVYLHFFFPTQDKVPDAVLIPIIEQTLPDKDYRNWYYALMDYGVYLAKTFENPNKRSKHYTKQSKFEGSKRQLRGKILRLYLADGAINEDHMMLADYQKDVVKATIEDMKKEGLVD